MAAYWVWWALAAIVVGAELMTGTFYLLAVGVAFVAGGLAAWLGASLDLGQSVRVLEWKDDGSARVNYRGTQWDAELSAPGVARAETMYIVGTRGSTLLVADRRS